jgi:hypothetical protein
MDVELKQGQVWSYKNRDGENDSRLTILKIENLNNIEIIHIRIDGLISNKNSSRTVPLTTIEHLPISLEMFKKSIIKLEMEVDASINDGYLYWKEEFLQGKAGIWSIEVAEVIVLTDKVYK